MKPVRCWSINTPASIGIGLYWIFLYDNPRLMEVTEGVFDTSRHLKEAARHAEQPDGVAKMLLAIEFGKELFDQPFRCFYNMLRAWKPATLHIVDIVSKSFPKKNFIK